MRHRDLALPAAAAGRERSSRFSTYRDGGLERFRRRVGVVVSDALIGRDRIIEYRECAELIAWHPNGGVSAKRGQAQQARLITPVPGGVGPTTVALLLAQTVDAADRR
jgi:hypothetical protein